MKFKKYTRYRHGDEIIGTTGLKCRDGDNIGELLPVFAIVVPSPGRKTGEIAVFSKKILKDLKEIPADGLRHPLIKEISEQLKNDPDFGETLIKFFTLAVGASSDEQKRKVFGWVKKYFPAELWRQR